MRSLSCIARCLILGGAALALAACVTTSFQTQKSLPADSERRIVVLPPDVELSILHVGGAAEPNAEWTANARSFIGTSLEQRFRAINAKLVSGESIKADFSADLEEHQLLKLHEAVGYAILVHQYPGPMQLPTKASSFEWTLGPKAAYLRQKHGADYALFVFVRDSYSSGARVAAQIVGALLGVGIQGGVQIGFASLVDLRTGEVVWFNRLLRGTGDLRNQTAADETVRQLLVNFPQ